jgi:hypothetical protein
VIMKKIPTEDDFSCESWVDLFDGNWLGELQGDWNSSFESDSRARFMELWPDVIGIDLTG